MLVLIEPYPMFCVDKRLSAYAKAYHEKFISSVAIDTYDNKLTLLTRFPPSEWHTKMIGLSVARSSYLALAMFSSAVQIDIIPLYPHRYWLRVYVHGVSLFLSSWSSHNRSIVAPCQDTWLWDIFWQKLNILKPAFTIICCPSRQSSAI